MTTDKWYSVVMVDGVCADSLCRDKAVGRPIHADMSHKDIVHVVMASVPAICIMMEQ